MDHSFNIKAAKLYGVEEAVLLHNIYFWIKKNKANNRHFYDGYFWTYNSVEAFSELFPYWTKRQVERILNNLIKKGAIIKANYNEKAYDRTSWYAITQTVESIYANGEMDFTKRGNGFHQTVEPIPDSNTVNKTISKLHISVFDEGWLDVWDEWLQFKKEIKKNYKTERSEMAAFNKLKLLSEKKDSQSGVFSLKASRMRGLSALPLLRSSSASASSRPSLPKYLCSR